MTAIIESPLSVAQSNSTRSFLLDTEKLQAMQAMANAMSKATISVPNHLRNNPGDCLAVTMQAFQWGMLPFAVAQKTHLVNGTLGYEAQLVNAVVQASGAITGRFHYEYRGEGQNLECRVGAIPSGENTIVWGEWLSSASVTTKNSPLWKTNPKQQLGYLQVKNWARLFAPGAILGVYSADELEETPIREVDMGAVDSVAPVYYPADDFEKNLPAWEKAIQSGKKTAAQVIGTIESKAKLSDEQVQRIRGLEAQPQSGPAVTYAEVADAINKAKTQDELDAAADLIGEVADAAHRAELSGLYNSLRAAA